MNEDTSLIKDVLEYSKNEIPAKFIKSKELIEKILAEGGKVVVWAIYVKNILDFQEYLLNNGIECRFLS